MEVKMAKQKKRYTFTFNHKRYSVFAYNAKEAGQLIQKRRADLEKDYQLSRGDMLLKNWAAECIEVYKVNTTPKTRTDFEYIVNHNICAHIGDLRLKTITPIDCQATLNLCAGKSKSLINKVYQAFRFLFGIALTNHKIATDPTEDLKKPAGTQKARRALTKDERGRVLSVCVTDRRYHVYLLMMLCGCRPREAAKVKKSDITDVMTIKGKVHLLHIRGTKTKLSDRKVPMPDMLYDLIKDLPDDEFISLTSRGTPYANNWSSYWRTFEKAADLPSDLCAYCLRHEFATECARRNIDIRVTAKLMGHSTISMTAIYTNLAENDILSVAEALNVHEPVKLEPVPIANTAT